MPKQRVHIVGAGPVGLITALGLCRKGIAVTVLESGDTVCRDLRACFYQPPSVDMLDEIGYLTPLLEGGTIDRYARFADVALGREFVLDLDVLHRKFRHPYGVSAGQNWFTQVGYDLLQREDCDFRFGYHVTSVEQDEDGATIHADTPDGPKSLKSDWVIGCDGGRSKIRVSQAIPFEGFSWPDRFLMIHTKFDFEPHFGRIAYLANGPDWRLIVKIPFGPGRSDWIYRVVSGVREDEDADKTLEPDSLQARLQHMLPQRNEYAIENAITYNVHQQVAQVFRKGRVLLAGDAAHLNNPMGGQGLNAGVHDAFNLVDKLSRILNGENDNILDQYCRQRRNTNWEYIQKISIENKRRNEEMDLDVRAKTMDAMEKTLSTEEGSFVFANRWSMGESLDYAAGIS